MIKNEKSNKQAHHFQIKKVMPEQKKLIQSDHSKLGFGQFFSDHMFLMEYDGKDWKNPRIEPYQNFQMDPATLVLHYGQGIFEGLKAYRNGDNIYLFRPEKNIERMNQSARRMMMPTFDEELVLEALKQLCIVEKEWIPDSHGTSLYLRPTMIAADVSLGVRPSNTYLFYIIASPVGAYYANGYNPIKLMVTEKYARTAPGGAGAVKTMGNYAAGLLATHESHEAGFNQVLWLDAVEKKYVEEVGVMNFFVLFKDELVTPKLTGTILPGVTRDSVITLAKSWNIKVSERLLGIDELVHGIQSGDILETFGSGTAAVISPISDIHYKDKTYQVADGKIGVFTQRMFDGLTSIQYGKAEDPFGWVLKVED